MQVNSDVHCHSRLLFKPKPNGSGREYQLSPRRRVSHDITYEELQQRYAARGLVVLGIGLAMENAATMEEFARKLNVHYTLLVGTPEVEKRFGILGIPTTILLDRNGIIRKRVVGFEYPSAFESALQQLL